MKSRPTQHDIAEALGIAQITVSRAFSGHPAVKDDLRARVLEEGRRLGYRLNKSANAMREGRQRAIGLLAGAETATSSTPLELFWGLEDACQRQGVNLVIGRYADDILTDSKKLSHYLRQWMVDGLVVYYTHRIPDGLKALLERLHLPHVWINADMPGAINPDDRGATRDAVRRLVEIGHREIGYAHSAPGESGHFSSAQRLEGYHAGMEEAGAKPTDVVLAPSAVDGKLYGAALAWVAVRSATRADLPTAWVAETRWHALAIVLALKEAGQTLGQDYALVNVDHAGFANLGLDLATEVIPTLEMAQVAVEQLEGLIAGGKSKRRRIIQYGFSPGRTLIPPPGTSAP